MKKIRKSRAINESKPDEKFAKKIISQFVVSVMIFAIVFINSKLPSTMSQAINQKIKHYLVVSIDFSKAVSYAKVYIEDFWNQIQTLPVNGDLQDTTKDAS